MESLEERVASIERRNTAVEIDKAWETSWARRALIALFTYITIGIFFVVIRVENPLLSAVVPALAFTISTLSMPYFKDKWLKRVRKTNAIQQ